MSLSIADYKYEYVNSNPNHAHDYIAKVLFPIISEIAKPNAKILDLGCGNGSLSNAIAQKGYQVVGMDNSASGIAMARQNFPNCEFLEGSIYQPSTMLYKNFDIIVSFCRSNRASFLSTGTS